MRSRRTPTSSYAIPIAARRSPRALDCNPQFFRPESVHAHRIGLPPWSRSLLPDEVNDSKDDHDQNPKINAVQQPQEHVPMSPKQIPCTSNHRHPNRSAQKIEEEKRAPRHAQDPSQRPGNHAHSKDKPRKENRERTVTAKERFPPSKRRRRYTKEALIALDQRPPTVVADRVSEIVPKRRRASCDHDDPRQTQSVLGVGKKAGEEQRGLTRHRNARILREQRNRNSPVAIISNELAKMLEEVQAKRVAGFSPLTSNL